jgi:hypothetical protein
MVGWLLISMKKLMIPLLGLIVVAAGCSTYVPPDAFVYETPYHRPLVSPGGQFGALPAAVQNTVRAEVGATEIADIQRDHFGHQDVYKIFFRNHTLWPPLYVAADGAVYDPNMDVAVPAAGIGGDVAHGVKVTDLSINDMSLEAQKVLRDRGVESDVLSIERQPWGNQSVFLITFKDPKKNPKLFVTTEGTVLKDLEK